MSSEQARLEGRRFGQLVMKLIDEGKCNELLKLIQYEIDKRLADIEHEYGMILTNIRTTVEQYLDRIYRFCVEGKKHEARKTTVELILYMLNAMVNLLAQNQRPH